MLARALRYFQRRNAARRIAEIGGMIADAGDNPAEVFDGVRYALPALLPRQVEKELRESNKLDDFIKEAYYQSTGRSHDRYRSADDELVYESPLHEWNYTTRYHIAEQIHSAYSRNPDARAVQHIANFAVGDGFHLITYHPLVEDFLEAFIEHPDNRIREYERQAATDLLVDGELVIRWYYDEADVPVIVPKPPWTLQGIETEMGRYRVYRAFYFVIQEDTGDSPTREFKTEHEFVPADDITFVAINNHAYELRGRSEIFPVLPWLKLRKEWLESRARISYWLSAILWRVSVETTNPQQMAAVVSRWSKPPKPGSVAIEHKNVTVEPLTASPNAMGAAEDGRQLLLQIAKGFHLPEYFMSDGHNVNLASATRQQLPMLMKVENHQRTLVNELWKPVFTKAIQREVDAGRLPIEIDKHGEDGEPLGEMIPTIEAFDVEYQPIIEVNIKDLTEALEKQVANEFISTRMARTQLGHSPDQVEKEIQEEKEKMRDEDAQGMGMDAPELENDLLSLLNRQNSNAPAPDEAPEEENQPVGFSIPR